MVSLALDEIFEWFKMTFNLITSNWIFASIFLVSILGLIADFYSNVRNK